MLGGDIRQCEQIENPDFTVMPAISRSDMHQLTDAMPDGVFDQLKKIT